MAGSVRWVIPAVEWLPPTTPLFRVPATDTWWAADGLGDTLYHSDPTEELIPWFTHRVCGIRMYATRGRPD